MQDVIPDNVSREQAPWSGDIEMAKLPIYYLTGEVALARHSLINTAYGIDKNGKMKCCWPSGLIIEFKSINQLYPEEAFMEIDHKKRPVATEIPHHSIQWLSSVWRHYFYTGDKDNLIELYPKMKLVSQWILSMVGENGLLAQNKEWTDRWDFMDWEGTKEPWIPLNFFMVEMLDSMVKAACEVGEDLDERYFNKVLSDLKEALIRVAWNEDIGAFVDCYIKYENGREIQWISEHSMSQAIRFGVIPKNKLDTSVKILAQGLPHASPVFKYFPYIALSENGRHDRVLTEFRNKWTNMRSVNALNTIQEVWEMESEDAVEVMCQSASAVPAFYLPAYILGVKPIKPGFREFVVEPNICDLNWIKGTVPTPFGNVSVDCRRTGNEVETNVEVPHCFIMINVEKTSYGQEKRIYRYEKENSL